MGIGDKKLTQERLHERIHYNPETGIMTLKKPPIRGGRVAIGDAMGSPMCHKKYMQLNFDGKRYLVHRLAWFYVYGEWPEKIDHINHIRTDNRLSNLRNVSDAENKKNQKLRSNNSSGVMGVFFCKSRKKWEAYIHHQNKKIGLGRRNDFFDAVCARKSAENMYGFHENHGGVA